MDPNACLDRIHEARRHFDGVEARAARQDLLDWLAKGGFEPDWERHPSAAEFVRKGRI